MAIGKTYYNLQVLSDKLVYRIQFCKLDCVIFKTIETYLDCQLSGFLKSGNVELVTHDLVIDFFPMFFLSFITQHQTMP